MKCCNNTCFCSCLAHTRFFGNKIPRPDFVHFKNKVK